MNDSRVELDEDVFSVEKTPLGATIRAAVLNSSRIASFTEVGPKRASRRSDASDLPRNLTSSMRTSGPE